VGNYLRTCQNLGRHVLLLEPDQDVYLEVLQPLLDVLEVQINVAEEENNDQDVHVQNISKFNIDCE
jgi:hypothetical protein